MTTEQGGVHEYRLFGLDLRSQIALPELEPRTLGGAGQVEIRLGDVAGPADGEALAAMPDGIVLSIENVARYRISDGRQIVVQPEPGASGRNVRLFLLGSAMGMLLHQRGILPLHANAIDIDGKAVAFMGKSGAGKSTLAAAFLDHGRCILSDDVCAIVREGDGFVAQAGVPRLRLWRDAVERTGRAVADCEPAFDTLDKYTLPVAPVEHAEALPLAAIYLLARDDADRAPEIRRLSGFAAVEALIQNTYRGSFITQFGDPQPHFATCLALSQRVPVFALSRRWDPDVIAATVTQVEAHVAQWQD